MLFDLVGRDAEVALVEPRRMRDRAAELLDEEAALAATLAQTWGATSHASKAASPDGDWPRLHLPFDRLLTHTDAPVRTIATAPEGPGTAVVTASGWDPVMGDGARLAKQLRELLADGFRVVVAADGKGSAGRLASLQVGGAELRDVPVVLHEPGPGIDGILGNTVLARYRVTVDADRRLLHLASR